MSAKQKQEANRLSEQYILADLLARAEPLGYGLVEHDDKVSVASFIVVREGA
jgi:hypothetical protein